MLLKASCALLMFTALAQRSSLADVVHAPADQPTVQAGIDAAQDGDDVLVLHSDTGDQTASIAAEDAIQGPPPPTTPSDRPRLSTGTVVPIGPFVGDRYDGFETQCPCNPFSFRCVPNGRLFRNVARLCAIGGSAHLGEGYGGETCTIRPHGGRWMYVNFPRGAEIRFDDEWEAYRFGGYFGTHHNGGLDAAVDFYDVDDNLVDSLPGRFPTGCGWVWQGWESSIPIRRIVITSQGQGFQGFELDDLEYSWREPAGCTRNPEPICDGDVDGDGQVNPVDSGLVQAAFGSLDEQDLCNYDLDCDGQINPVDAGIVQSLFGTCEPVREVCP